MVRRGVVYLRKAPVPFVEPCEPHRDVIAIHEDVVGSGNRLDQKEQPQGKKDASAHVDGNRPIPLQEISNQKGCGNSHRDDRDEYDGGQGAHGELVDGRGLLDLLAFGEQAHDRRNDADRDHRTGECLHSRPFTGECAPSRISRRNPRSD